MHRQTLIQAIERFRGFGLDGGQLALDFTNTVDWRNTEKEHEWLEGYADLLGWGVRVGLLTAESAGELSQTAKARKPEAEALLLRARELRELLFRIFEGVIEGRPAAAENWRQFNQEMQSAMGSAAIEAQDGEYVWSFARQTNRLDFFRGPVLKAAADLLVGGDHSRLKRCSTPDCQWLFVDTSKNNSRRWCDMQSCGNRAKAKRYYQKARQSRGKPERQGNTP